MNLHFIWTLSVEQMIWWELTKASGFKCLAPALAPKLICVAAGSMWTVSRKAMFPWYFIILITSHIAGSDLSQSSSSAMPRALPHLSVITACHWLCWGDTKGPGLHWGRGSPKKKMDLESTKHEAPQYCKSDPTWWKFLTFLEVDVWKHPDSRAEMLTLISFPMPASKNKQTTTKSLLSCLFISHRKSSTLFKRKSHRPQNIMGEKAVMIKYLSFDKQPIAFIHSCLPLNVAFLGIIKPNTCFSQPYKNLTPC